MYEFAAYTSNAAYTIEPLHVSHSSTSWANDAIHDGALHKLPFSVLDS